MKVVEVRRESDLPGLKAGWDALLRSSASNTIFLTWEWMHAWWSAYGKAGDLRILAAYDDTGVLRGIAPLRSQTMRKYGQAVTALSFACDGSNDTDYLDFIIAAGYEEQVLKAFLGHWPGEFRNGAVLLLNEVPETSPNLPVLRSLAEPEHSWQETDIPCGSVRLPGSWDEYLKSLRSRFRTKIRSVLRDLEGRPEIRFGFCESPEAVERMLPILYDLHTRRWALDGKPGVFGWDRKRDFYASLSPAMLDRGWLRLSWMEWNGRTLACQYGFAYEGKYFLLQEGYEPAAEHWNPGIGLRAWSIREFLKEGLREYDFLGGRTQRHRSDWGAETKQSKKVLLASPSYKNLLVRRGPEWEARARESAVKLLPESLLAARRARLQQQLPAPAEPGSNGHAAAPSGADWVRNAAAKCYFHFRVPEVTRSLRERYQLSTAPKVSWTRRTQASARILYYHRVNDDNDPFFPAISTELFEQEMRYVSRNYKVVSLSELMNHLDGGAAEPQVAITFDDGYQDNYTQAFPILQRYGLPAAIFLATGSIDSREPLWFERLAEAVKNTPLEFIDLEIDLPRRFWTRTVAERLDANGRIFALLRGLRDSERQEYLPRILQQLSAPAASERNGKMLTWDQVRLMKKHGIDFGGHTVTHPFLSRMTAEQVTWEVTGCKRRIEEELQSEARYFAYPNGREEDFGKWNKDLIRNAGYQAAVTTIWGVNYPSTDPMELRRGQPWEENPALFAYKLDWYQLVND